MTPSARSPSAARDAVERSTGRRPTGPVRLLANLRYFGHVFNPVCFYYCFDPAGERVESVVADVNNIPWGERHPYVLDRGHRRGRVLHGGFAKQIHVSPLMGMDQSYRFSATEPGERLQVHIESHPTTNSEHPRCERRTRAAPATGREAEEASAPSFDATLSLRRRELNRAEPFGNARPLSRRCRCKWSEGSTLRPCE